MKRLFEVSVPLSHRMGKVSGINQYNLVRKLAKQVSRNSVTGGGTGGNTYDISIEIPEKKVAIFLKLLALNKITNYVDCGEI